MQRLELGFPNENKLAQWEGRSLRPLIYDCRPIPELEFGVEESVYRDGRWWFAVRRYGSRSLIIHKYIDPDPALLCAMVHEVIKENQ